MIEIKTIKDGQKRCTPLGVPRFKKKNFQHKIFFGGKVPLKLKWGRGEGGVMDQWEPITIKLRDAKRKISCEGKWIGHFMCFCTNS